MNQLLRAFILLITVIVSNAFYVSGQQTVNDQEFLDAVEKSEIPRVKAALAKGANVNAKEPINGHNALQYAINSDLELVRLLLDKGANVNLPDRLGWTALIDAADDAGPNHVAIVKLLLERGADVHVADDAAVLRAARRGDPEILRMLLAKGALVNVRDTDREGDTVLMASASGASVEKVGMLLAAGADLKATNNDGETALMKAVRLEHFVKPEQRIPIIELLIKKGADVNGRDKNGTTPLLHSVTQYMSESGGIISHPEVVKLLLDHGADVQAKNNSGDNALMLTAEVWKGPIEIVQLLLARGIDVNAQNRKGITALMIAAEKDRIDIVQLLLEKNADLSLQDTDGETALDHAIGDGHAEIAKVLLAKGATSKGNYKTEAELLSATRNYALLRAAYTNNLSEVKNVLAAGADPNYRNQHGSTPLMLAIENSYGRNEVALLLIEKGADLNLTNEDGETALIVAISHNDLEATKMLLDRKASLSPRNKKQQSALHLASAGVRAKMVAAILESTPGAGEINAPDIDGRTPLILAANSEHFVPDETMDLLLKRGANINVQDNQGNTALILATKCANMAGVAFLLKNSARVDLKNNEGQTALRLARQIHSDSKISNGELLESRIVALLVDAGAKE